MSVIYLSQEGLDNLKSELNKLKSVDRPNIINQIAEARDKGDLSENAEYDAAKEAQGLLEARIVKLENDIANSRVLDKITDTSTVHLLTEVVIKNLQNGMEMKNVKFRIAIIFYVIIVIDAFVTLRAPTGIIIIEKG